MEEKRYENCGKKIPYGKKLCKECRIEALTEPLRKTVGLIIEFLQIIGNIMQSGKWHINKR